MEDLKTEVLRHLSAIWRRKWMAVAVWWLVCIVGWGVVITMPNRYEASTRIYVDVDSLLTPLLKGLAVETDPSRYLDYLRNTLLSRPNLEKVSILADLPIDGRTPAAKDAMLAALAHNVGLTNQSTNTNLLTISYSDVDPVVAKNVVQAFLTLFSERSSGESRNNMANAQQFLNDEIARYEKLLRESEQRRAEFRNKFADVLPGAGNTVSRLTAMRQSVATLQEQYVEAVTKRNALKAELDTVPQFMSVDSSPQVIFSNNGRVETPTEKRLDEAKHSLDTLRLRYTDQHPDVVSARQLVTALEKDVEAERKAGTASSGSRTPGANTSSMPRRNQITNTVYEQLQVRLADMDSTVASLERRLSDAKTELERVEEIARTVPGVEAKAQDLDRDYDVIKRNYEELLQRRESAKLAEAADNKADKIHFRIVDPPIVPSEPSWPNRPLMYSAVLLIGFAAGAAVPFLLAQLDRSFASIAEMKAAGLPVLGGITKVLELRSRWRHSINLMGLTACTLVLLCAYGLLFVYGARVAHKILAIIA